jgi:hypothetical protein
MTDEDATSGFCTNTSSPKTPLDSCLQAARVKDRQPSMSQRPSVPAILPAVLHIESLGFANVVAASRPSLGLGRRA